MPDFNDTNTPCSEKKMADRRIILYGIFKTPVVDFSRSRGEGAAYRYLISHFATMRGKAGSAIGKRGSVPAHIHGSREKF